MASAMKLMKCIYTLCTKTINRTFPSLRFASFFRLSFCFAFLRFHRRMRFIWLHCFKISFKLFWGTVFILTICHVCESVSERYICVFVRKFGADNGFFGPLIQFKQTPYNISLVLVVMCVYWFVYIALLFGEKNKCAHTYYKRIFTRRDPRAYLLRITNTLDFVFALHIGMCVFTHGIKNEHTLLAIHTYTKHYFVLHQTGSRKQP